MQNCLKSLLLAGLLALQQTCFADPSCAAFDAKAMQFAGTPLQQAACLVRGLHEHGLLDRKPTSIPVPLTTLVGEKIEIPVARYRAFLMAQGIAERDIGGSLDDQLSRGNSNAPDAPEAGYFVIHDTSTPNMGTADFPATMNDKSWSLNSLGRYVRGKPEQLPGCFKSTHPEDQPVAHAFVNRLGESVAPVDFAIPWRATQFEKLHDCRAKGLFLHVELIEPRRSDPKSAKGNDALSPVPAFTAGQYRRLAIIYVAASIRHGRWLVPSFHATLDEGISDGHDDPQGFSLTTWAAALGQVLREIGAK